MWLSVTALMTPPVMTTVVAAADPTASFNPYSLIGSVVTPVIVVLLLLFGKLRTESESKRQEETLEAYRDQLRLKDEQLQQLQTALQERVIPALTRATLVLETLSPLLQTELSFNRPHRQQRRATPGED